MQHNKIYRELVRATMEVKKKRNQKVVSMKPRHGISWALVGRQSRRGGNILDGLQALDEISRSEGSRSFDTSLPEAVTHCISVKLMRARSGRKMKQRNAFVPEPLPVIPWDARRQGSRNLDRKAFLRTWHGNRKEAELQGRRFEVESLDKASRSDKWSQGFNAQRWNYELGSENKENWFEKCFNRRTL